MAGPAPTRLVVMSADAETVGRTVRELRGPGVVVAGFVGEEEALAREMGAEMLGGVDEVVRAGERRG